MDCYGNDEIMIKNDEKTMIIIPTKTNYRYNPLLPAFSLENILEKELKKDIGTKKSTQQSITYNVVITESLKKILGKFDETHCTKIQDMIPQKRKNNSIEITINKDIYREIIIQSDHDSDEISTLSQTINKKGIMSIKSQIEKEKQQGSNTEEVYTCPTKTIYRVELTDGMCKYFLGFDISHKTNISGKVLLMLIQNKKVKNDKSVFITLNN